MRMKAQYLQDAKSQMGINRSRTRMQRNEERKKINGKKLAGGSGDRKEVQKKVGEGYRIYTGSLCWHGDGTTTPFNTREEGCLCKSFKQTRDGRDS